jgi:hypothetical protein
VSDVTFFAPDTAKDLLETLAAFEHESWSHWQRYLHDQCDSIELVDGDGLPIGEEVLAIPADKFEHWEWQIATPYVELPEHSKQADRDEVMKWWPVFIGFVAKWIYEQGKIEGQEAEYPGAMALHRMDTLRDRWLRFMENV